MHGAHVFETLVRMVQAHLAANGQPTDGAEEMVDRQTAARLVFEGFGTAEWVSPIPSPEKGRRSVYDYLQGTRAALTARAFKLKGKPLLAPRKRAAMRAEICAACPFNQPPQEEGVLRELRDFTDGKMAQIVEGRTTPFDAKLQSCQICTCLNGTKVHFSNEFLQATTDRKLFRRLPSTCWIVQELRGAGLAPSTQAATQHIVTGTARAGGHGSFPRADLGSGSGCATCGR